MREFLALLLFLLPAITAFVWAIATSGLQVALSAAGFALFVVVGLGACAFGAYKILEGGKK